VEPGQELLQKWEARADRFHPRMEITCDGLMLGAGTILAKMTRDQRGGPRLALDDEPRAMALLTTAYEQPIAPHVLRKVRRACELWNADEKASLIFISPMRICRSVMKTGVASVRGGRAS
jgi:hypothetical protein